MKGANWLHEKHTQPSPQPGTLFPSPPQARQPPTGEPFQSQLKHFPASLQDSGGPAAPAPRLPTHPSALARLYHKKVVDHYENPPKVGFLNKTSKNVGTRLVGLQRTVT